MQRVRHDAVKAAKRELQLQIPVCHWYDQREEAVIVRCAMEIMAENPEISRESLCVELSRIEGLKIYHKDFLEMSSSTADHYKYCAMIFSRLRKALDEKVTGYEVWSESDFNKLLSTGIMLCEAAYDLRRIRAEQNFLFEMKKVLDYLPAEPYPHNLKALITGYVKDEIRKMDPSEIVPKKHSLHDKIVNGPGKGQITQIRVCICNDRGCIRKERYGYKQEGPSIRCVRMEKRCIYSRVHSVSP